ncbi:hydantoinase/oxoprolinase family protein [Spongiactinospora rosea]|uniref:hydantoinase/oxoprolinase family protein n=1 Tax=Spongiactinospora rosea TaxID=2248750 RepID=UPI0013143F35|nr:hydantoinase/oxoprolinase family protein [Spongiactinospora rosea]
MTPESHEASAGTRKRYRIGFDIGGTFTDFALHDSQTGELHVWKRLSTNTDPSVGALAGIDDLLGLVGGSMDEVGQVVHGTTIGANIVIERKGAVTALLVTDGFRDLLIMQRPARYSTYDLWFDKHEPLIPRHHVVPVRERMAYDGTVVRELDETDLRSSLEELRAAGIEAVAVSLLHSYAANDHETRVGKLVSELLPEASTSLSHEVAPITGEYERTSTTVVNAYIQPAFRRYLDSLERALAERGFTGQVFINQGNGGLTTPAEVVHLPIRALESGPAAGVSMAAWIGRAHGRGDLVAFDMGGTTAKACLIEDGEPKMERVFDVDQTLMRVGTGLPVVTPSVDLIEIGAGGGSIARVGLGIIEVGPESAGAEPGPICYGRGGTRPTVTDANVVLGYLNPDFFLGGRMSLDVDGAREAIAAQVGAPLGLDAGEAAWGVHEAVTANMEHAIRAVSIERGRDPRDLTLVALGGAGPTHAARLARNLGIGEVIFPAAAGIASAVGLLQAAPRVDLIRTFVSPVDEPGMVRLGSELAELDAAVNQLLDNVTPGAERSITYRADMQYAGQGHVVEVEIPRCPAGELAGALRERFDTDYAAMYGYRYPDAQAQITSITVAGSAAPAAFELPPNAATGARARDESRRVYFPELSGYVRCAVHRRDDLPTGTQVEGPAVIEDGQCAILLLPGDTATVDGHRNVLARIGRNSDPAAGDLTTGTTTGRD